MAASVGGVLAGANCVAEGQGAGAGAAGIGRGAAVVERQRRGAAVTVTASLRLSVSVTRCRLFDATRRSRRLTCDGRSVSWCRSAARQPGW